MTVVMISNALSHHQLDFCQSMRKQPGVSFYYIACKPLAQERLQLGYSDLNHSEDYVIRSYESPEAQNRASELIAHCDFAIFGSAPFLMIRNRICSGKWTFVYSERIFKNGWRDYLNPRYTIPYFMCFLLVSHRHLRLLCASAYASRDYRLFGLRTKNAYQWGYFPPIAPNAAQPEQKTSNSILWVGRFIDWKHPLLAVSLAKELRKNGFSFHLTMIGDGTEMPTIREMIAQLSLEHDVTLLGALPTAQVREQMERAEILLATSDFNEGWGAVVNEGMSAGCAVVASHAMGSVPYLIDDGKNGLIFESGNADDLYRKTAILLSDPSELRRIASAGFETMINEWNGKNAAAKLTDVMRHLQNGDTNYHAPSGICSPAKPLKNNWYHGKTNHAKEK